MTKYLAIIGLVLLVACSPMKAGGVGAREAGVVPADGQALEDGSKADACDCCTKCSAAKGTIRSQEDERKDAQDEERKRAQEEKLRKARQIEGRKTQPEQGARSPQGEDDDENDGCEECCARCGKELKPQSQEAPPEVIEQKLRPELRDNQ